MHPTARQWRAISVAIAFVSLPGPAFADTFLVAPNSGTIAAQSHRILMTKTGNGLTIVDETVVLSQATSAVWIRAFPNEPVMANVDPEMFDVLESSTQVYEPHNQVIRRNLFGPSVVTVLTNKLVEQPELVDLPAEPEPLRSLAISDVSFFRGSMKTSTVTRQMELPRDFEAWLTDRAVTIDPPLRNAFAAQLNRNWVLMAAVVTDKAPSKETRARLGPIRFDADSPTFTYPIVNAYAQGRSVETFDFYTLAPYPMAASFNETLWNTRPWEVSHEGPALLEATYSQALDPEGPIAFELGEKQGLALPPNAHLVKVRYRPTTAEPWRDLDFQQSRETIRIPGETTRGNGLDLFLCILLGLTPLIYTPESWFLIWLVNAAKERARKEGSAFGLNLWAYFALVVSLFWVLTLEGPGRIAGLIPFMVGIGRLAWPYTDREAPRVRAAFKKKKKA